MAVQSGSLHHIHCKASIVTVAHMAMEIAPPAQKAGLEVEPDAWSSCM